MPEPPQQSVQHDTTPVVASIADRSPYDKRQQLFQELMKDRELLLKNRLEVRHLMTPNPILIAPTMTLNEMATMMHERHFRHLLVGGPNGELLGVVSDRDLVPQRGSTAQQVMTFPALTATPDTPLNPAITFLINENISCLPVIEHGRVIGIITTTDLILTLQCMLQLWMRISQILQHESGWLREADKIIHSIDGGSNPAEFAQQVQQVRDAIHHHVDDIVNCIDLRADLLTGINNRRSLEEMLDMLLAMWRRYGHTFSLVIVSIDHYERIRKTCGDAAVKPLLRTLTKLVEQLARTSDFVARCRDDAFAVVLTHTEFEGAVSFCQRLRKAAKEDANLELPLRICTGIVTPNQGEDGPHLLDRAESVVTSE
jgi:diguanylate cyclase (GGDEF)-like protein